MGNKIIQNNSSLIIGWKLQGRHILIIGNNHITANRIEFVLDANPRKITLITPVNEVSSDKIKKYIAEHAVTHKNSEFNEKYLVEEPVDLILTAVDDVKLSHEIASIARKLKIPINVAEISQLCDFLFVPTYRDGPLQVAISTNGTSSQISRKLRQHIIESLPKNLTSAINNVSLIKKEIGNNSIINKITNPLPLQELADLTNDDIKRLVSECKNLGDESDASSESSTTLGDSTQLMSIKSKIMDNDITLETLTKGGIRFMDGKTAVSYVAYALSNTSFIYPTLRSHYVGEVVSHWSSQNAENAFGKVCNAIQMNTRSGAISAILGAASYVNSGDVISVFSSSNSIVSMISNLYNISHKKIPLVIHVSAYGFNENFEKFSNYNDAFLARDTGLGIINSYSIQEIHDIALITHLVSISTSSSYLHIFDGVKTAQESSKVNLLSYSEIHKINKEVIAEGYPLTTSNSVDIFEKIAIRIGKILKHVYKAFEYIGSPTAETLLIVYGGETAVVKETVDRISKNGSKIGAIIVRVYRPWSEKHFLAALPKTTKRIAVLEQVSSNMGGSYNLGSTLFNDVSISLYGGWTGSRPQLIDVKYSPSQKFNFRVVNSIIKQLQEGKKRINFDENLPVDKNSPTLTNVNQYLFWDTESRKTFSSSQHIAQILANNLKSNVSSLPTFDIYNNGGVVTTKLQLGSGVHDVESGVDFISINDASLTSKYNTLTYAKDGAIVLLNTNWTVDELETKLPNDFRYEAANRNIRLYIIDVDKIVNDLNLDIGDVGTNVVLQAAFFKIIDSEIKFYYNVSDTISSFYESNNEKEVGLLFGSIVQETEKAIIHVEIPPTWLILEKSEQILLPNIIDNSFCPNLDQQLTEIPKLTSWHTTARNFLFKEAYKTNQTVRPDVSEKTFTIHVSENRRLTPESYDRYLFHIEFDTSGTDLKYDLGEALGVYGHNDTEEVNRFLEYYELNPDDIISILNKEGDKYESRTIFQVFSQVLDVFGRPPKRFYETLAQFATDEKEKNKLLFIAGKEGTEEFKNRVSETSTYADILYEFTSARPPVEDLVQMITPIKPRHYSIASAQSVHPNSVHLLVVTVEWSISSGSKRYGHCTRYLSRLKIGTSVTVSIKPSVMKLPPRDSQPVIMAGLGTGMAPFRAFIEERAYRKSQGKEVGPMILYFGSRNRSMEYLYGEELEAYHTEGLLTYLRLAFSRDQPQKVYIQHKMNEDSALIQQYLMQDEGWFYLCGPTWPVPDVKDAIVKSFMSTGELTAGEANDWVNKLKDMERYILEVY
ncbi:2203_t:CDS:1 [Diversispora eburnea]|uniref:2203_t:CDS:1 n=1 Tax=Diversispora eburnea TaxID=1213867 RepID=A0A9N8VC19_9GLOM|nr:2203_t:CDS:1 [Diversispora eburnea]